MARVQRKQADDTKLTACGHCAGAPTSVLRELSHISCPGNGCACAANQHVPDEELRRAQASFCHIDIDAARARDVGLTDESLQRWLARHDEYSRHTVMCAASSRRDALQEAETMTPAALRAACKSIGITTTGARVASLVVAYADKTAHAALLARVAATDARRKHLEDTRTSVVITTVENGDGTVTTTKTTKNATTTSTELKEATGEHGTIKVGQRVEAARMIRRADWEVKQGEQGKCIRIVTRGNGTQVIIDRDKGCEIAMPIAYVKPAASNGAAKKTTAKKTATPRAAAPAAKKTTAKKTATPRAAAKKAPAKKTTTAKKTTARKTTARKTTAAARSTRKTVRKTVRK